MRLNGWHRLFVVLGVVYALVLLVGFHDTFPTRARLDTRWAETVAAEHHPAILAELREAHDENLNSLRRRQLWTIGFLTLAWAVPMAVLYGAGCTIAWVRQGFARPSIR